MTNILALTRSSRSSDEYRSCDNKWYFLTPRERQCPKGSRPNRKVGNLGKWKAAQKDAAVLDVKGKEVGRKRSLNFLDENGIKTSRLMQEYTTTHPNLPLGTGPQTMLTNWVLCKIYKLKETKEENNQAKQQLVRVRNDQEEEISVHDEQNQLHIINDEPSPKRTRLASDVDYNYQHQQGTNSTSQQYYDHHYQQNQKQMSTSSMTASTSNTASTSSTTTTPNDDHQQTAPSSMIVTTTTPPSCPPLSLDMFLDDDDPDWVAALDSWNVLDDIDIPADDEFGRYLLEELVF